MAEWMSRRACPRLLMAGALALGAAAGVACSVALRSWGLSAMWLRYPLSFAAAYAVLVFILGRLAHGMSLRLEASRREVRRAAVGHQFRSDPADSPDFDDLLDRIREGMENANQQGQPTAYPRALPLQLTLLLALTVALVCLYCIWMAPLLLAELVAEGALVAWLYRPTSRGTAGWLPVALEQTGMPALVVAATFAGTGWVFQLYAPHAETVVEVWEQILDRRAVNGQPAPRIGRR